MNNEKLTTRSLQFIQTEKMVIILKELKNIKQILEFFCGYDDCQKQSKDTKPIKRNIRYLLKDIDSLQKKIERLKTINEDLENQELMLFLIQYDYIRIEIEDMLKVIQALYHKMQQLFGEALNQYLPYPVLGRRFSNNGIMMYLNNYYRELYKTLSLDGQPKKNLMLSWNYRTGFQYRILLNRELKRENYQGNTYNNYIDLPYWYYELPMLLPAITHEVAYLSLRHPSKTTQPIFQDLEKRLNDFLHDSNNNFVQKVQEVIGYEKYSSDLAKVIMGDVIAYQIHGSSYVHSLFHNIIGEKLSQDFLKLVYDEKDDEKIVLLPNEWIFSQKKDHSILRLNFMLTFIAHDNGYKEMKNILQHIMPLLKEDKENQYNIKGFSRIYRYNHPNYYSSYLNVQNYLSQLLYTLIEWREANLSSLNQIHNIKNAPNFSKLWQERFDTLNSSKDVMHQNNFRREVHQAVTGVKFLKTLKKDEPIIYLLELGKARKDLGKNADIVTSITNELKRDKEIYETHTPKNSEHIKLQLSVYGIYDWVTIKEKSSTTNILTTLSHLLKKEEVSKEKRLKYFITKQVLMKVSKTISGTIDKKLSSFSVIFNIEIEKKIHPVECSNGYENLSESIKQIARKLNDNKKMFKEANIYKSLGPKDLTVIVENSDLNYIFQLLEMINQENHTKGKEGDVLRTFTIICSPFHQKLTVKSQLPNNTEKFSLISYLRISNHFDRNDRYELIEKDKMLSFTEVTGIMDFRIQWKEETLIEKVIDYYNRMIGKGYLTDFQTKIEKVFL